MKYWKNSWKAKFCHNKTNFVDTSEEKSGLLIFIVFHCKLSNSTELPNDSYLIENRGFAGRVNIFLYTTKRLYLQERDVDLWQSYCIKKIIRQDSLLFWAS